MKHDFYNFVKTTHTELQDEYNRIKIRAKDDPSTAGDQGEENWKKVFKDWLPEQFHIVTKGRIISDSNVVSPQVDLLVLCPSYPKILLDKKLYLASGVVAAFECKITLKSHHIKEAIKTSAIVKNLVDKRMGTPYKESNSSIIFGLLSHSHAWKSRDENKIIKKVDDQIWEADKDYVKSIRDCIDFVVLGDIACWECSKIVGLSESDIFDDDCSDKCIRNDRCLASAYICHSFHQNSKNNEFTPIGSFLCGITRKMAWEYVDLRRMNQYYSSLKLKGSGRGKTRFWSLDCFSERLQKDINNNKLVNVFEYNEWQMLQ